MDADNTYLENEELEEEELSDEEFSGWLTLGKTFSDEVSRADDTMQGMLIMTKIQQSHIDDKIINKYKDVIISLIKDNMKSLIGKHFKIVYLDSEDDLQLYANVLYRKDKIALIGAR